MARPSVFHLKVIDFIHLKRGPFSLRDIRDAVGASDPKTIKNIVIKLTLMKYMTYLDNKSLSRRWVITKKWPSSADVVKSDYELLTMVRQGIKMLRRSS
jgi:hypothetical protein